MTIFAVMGNRCSDLRLCFDGVHHAVPEESEALSVSCWKMNEDHEQEKYNMHFGPMLVRHEKPKALAICSHKETVHAIREAADQANWSLNVVSHEQANSSFYTTPAQLLSVHVIIISFAKAKTEDALHIVSRLDREYGDFEKPIFMAVTDRRLSTYEERLCRDMRVHQRVECSTKVKDWIKLLTFLEACVIPLQRCVKAAPGLFTALDHVDNPVEISDAQNIVQYVNGAFERVTGCRRSEVLGTVSSELRRSSLPKDANTAQEKRENEAADVLAAAIPWHCFEVPGPSSSPQPEVDLCRKRQNVHIRPHVISPASLPFLNSFRDINGMYKPLLTTHRRQDQSSSAVDTPISELLLQLQELEKKCANNEELRRQLQKVMKILNSTELYSPLSHFKEEDKVASDLFGGLVLNGPVPHQSKPSRKASISENLNLKCNLPATRHTSSLPGSTPAIATVLEVEPTWDFDILHLERLTTKRPLVHVGMKIFARWNMSEFLQCSESTLQSWLEMVESHYHLDNPYHNATHASDMLHAVACYLNTEKIARLLDHSEAVACLLAAVVHDLDHPGKTSAFLINTKHPLALLYNDMSVLENHHAALAFQLTLSDPRRNIFAHLGRAEYTSLRKNVVDMVLATDMHRHFEYVTKFKQTVEAETEGVADLVQSASDPLEGYSRSVCRMLIKCADISNPTRPWNLCKEWAHRIVEEYFRQTEEEKAKGLPLTMEVFDRNSCNLPLTQCRFVDVFARDMFQVWCSYVDMPKQLDLLETNYSRWKKLCYENPPLQHPPVSDSSSLASSHNVDHNLSNDLQACTSNANSTQA